LPAEDPDLLRGAGGEPAAGSGGDQGGATSVLARAAKLRFPKIRDLNGPRERIDALVDHITDTAILRGELEEVRLNAETELLLLRGRWNRIPTVRGKTQSASEAAKRDANRDLAEQIDTARWLIARCTEAIARFGGSDYDAASRAYTLLAG
jgi:hypothetical protein